METKLALRFCPHKNVFRILGPVIAVTFLWIGNVTAQDSTAVAGKLEATIQLSFHKNADLRKTAMAKVMAVKNDKHIIGSWANLHFYLQTNAGQQLLKTIKADKQGNAMVDLPAELPADAKHHFTITAKIENDSLYQDAEEQITNSEVNLSIQLQSGDTANVVKTLVTEPTSGGPKPVKDVEVKFYVQRLFGIMPVREENSATTDEDGMAMYKFSKGIPGDTAGNLIILARIEDNDAYGNVEAKATAAWGIPLAIDKNPFPRALWLPYAPPTLILVICVLFGGVWSAYFYMFYQLRKIKRQHIDDKQPDLPEIV